MRRVMLGVILISILLLIGTEPEIQRVCASNCIPIEALCLPVLDMPEHCVSPYEVGSPEVRTIEAIWYANCGGCNG